MQRNYHLQPLRQIYIPKADVIQQIFLTLAGKHRSEWILEADIKECFDEINHQWLLKSIPIKNSILKKCLKSGYIEKKTLYPTHAGTPQGGIIFPVLANMALDGWEEIINQEFGKKGSKKRKQIVVYLVRYADDFVVTTKHRETLTLTVKPLLEKILKERGLTL